MKKFGKTLLVSVMVSTLVITPVFAAPSVDDLKQKKAAAESEVNTLQDELTALLDKVNKLEKDLIAKGEAIGKATKDLKAAEEKEKQQYEDMKLRIKFMYEEGNESFLETLMSAEDFSDLINKAEYVQNVNTYDRNMLNEYVATKEKIATLKTQLENDQKKMVSLQKEYETQEDTLNATITSKQAEVENFGAEIQAAAERAAEAERARQEAAAAENNGGSDSGNNNSGNNNSDDTQNSEDKKPTKDPGGNSGSASAIVSAAYSYIGVPYAWGEESRSGIDCSGLVMRCHQAAGISVARTSGALGGGGKAVSNPQPGDVVCYAGHVGIYIGGGQMIHAPRPGKTVEIRSVYGSPWYRRYW